MKTLGEPDFRSKQIYEWIHQKKVQSPEEMTNLSKKLREKLAQQGIWDPVQIAQVQVSQQDGTKKYLMRLAMQQVYLRI